MRNETKYIFILELSSSECCLSDGDLELVHVSDNAISVLDLGDLFVCSGRR